MSVWRTSYIHTDSLFKEHLRDIHNQLREAVFDVDKENWNVLDGRDKDKLNFRTVELHEYTAGGTLGEDNHYDMGSLITLDVMLQEPDSGGEFITPEEDGSKPIHEFLEGDAMFFLSHKYHQVAPVTSGTRIVLVAEIWEGPERQCPHRCQDRDFTQSRCEEKRLTQSNIQI